ncbi:hypothetical protein DV515_00012032 [Chloebia gouldiae]|uniref:Uncharacterized protein n=1 Tax=Chloebia gouldiae TaxID=44316 RepID=A0A3L8S5U9_CHLGU|nr:hypothetical protein DV515_00012032 [Chloebia gouldiae]
MDRHREERRPERPCGSFSHHFRLHFRLWRLFPWGPRWRRRVSARGGGTAGTQRHSRHRDLRHPAGFGRVRGRTPERGGGQEQGERAARGGPEDPRFGMS